MEVLNPRNLTFALSPNGRLRVTERVLVEDWHGCYWYEQTCLGKAAHATLRRCGIESVVVNGKRFTV